MPRVVITGGTGFLGFHLCERLLDEECEVIALDNLLTGAARNVEPYITLARRELGWQPSIGFDDCLSRTVEWFRERADLVRA
jgi:nucleoside-diphosphate-sugar epimerase